MLLIGMQLTAQTRLIIFSENNQNFIANINDRSLIDENKTFFEFNNIMTQDIVLKVKLDNNQGIKKSIRLEKGIPNIYAITNNDGYYEIVHRGNYEQIDVNNKMPIKSDTDKINSYKLTEIKEINNQQNDVSSNELEKSNYKPQIEVEEEEIDYAKNELININALLDELINRPNDKSKTLFIVNELNKGKFNCRQLKYIFTKIEDDYSKLYTFKSTIHRCIDKENSLILMQSFESEKYQDNFKELVSYL